MTLNISSGQTSSSEKPKRSILSTLIEFAFWVIVAPVLAVLISLILKSTGIASTGTIIAIFMLAAAAGLFLLFKPQPSLQVGRGRAMGILLSSLFAATGLAGQSNSTSPDGSAPIESDSKSAPVATLSPEVTSTASESVEAKEARLALEQEQKAASKQAAEAEVRTKYVERLERELSSLNKDTLLESTATPDQIIISAAVFIALAGVYDEGEQLALEPDQEKVRQRFKSHIVGLQTEVFPVLRDKYGPALSRKLWEEDMEVRTFGTGYRTIEFTWGGFAANKNIAEFQREVSENLEALRFKQTRYKWYKGASEWTYFDMSTPQDGALVISRQGRLVSLAEE